MIEPEHRVLRPRAETRVYRCPCCGYKTLYGRGQNEICPVCFWEDDGQDDADAHLVLGGPNGALSLSHARHNFKSYGASEDRNRLLVRSPKPEEY